MQQPADPTPRRPARVLVVAGPSGSGKSRLCQRLSQDLGLPTVNLDDFYKNGDDPSLPRRPSATGPGLVDWDDPASWSAEDALAALERLCREGEADVPVYDIARDGRTGVRRVALAEAPYVLAEGLFAHEIVTGCRRLELLADAVCVRNSRLLTFWRRLSRDLRERRKPPLVLLRRGWRLMRTEAAVVARAQVCGATPMTSPQAYARLRSLVLPADPAPVGRFRRRVGEGVTGRHARGPR